MKGTNATDAKNKFGHLLEMAITEPVAIEKQGRRVAVIISAAEYERLTALEDKIWGEKALAAVSKGFLSEKETKDWIKGKLNAEAPVRSRSKEVS
ncbi:MAG: type II toxin-antitoxin system Phd/YefM family antitoxin [Syntrophales bacterium]|nr:type II toxin-antitoxin system Phd/YefM family antitoxin [Syntrophales bacterium]